MSEKDPGRAPAASESSSLWRRGRPLDRAVLGVASACGAIAGFGFMVLMVVIVVDVSMRQYGGRGIGGAADLAEVVLPALVYLGMSTAETGQNHVRTPLLTNRLPARAGNAVRAMSLALATGFVGWLTVESLRPAVDSFVNGEHRFGILSIPIWPSRIAIAVGLAIFTVVLASGTIKTVRLAVRGDFVQHQLPDLP